MMKRFCIQRLSLVFVFLSLVWTTPSVVAQSGCGQRYTVQKGDTLGAIAKRCGTTVNTIMKANKLTSTTIRIGEQLVLSGNAGNSAGGNAGTAHADIIYVVKKGDTLVGIATKFGTTVEVIKRSNGLTNDQLTQGNRISFDGEVKGKIISTMTMVGIGRGG
jgi:LysM repeat protein